MHANEALIDKLYSAFARRDHETMASCYTPDVRFSDPVFTDLSGDEVRAMWRMLCERGTDLELSHNDVSADDHRGSADWEASYTFTATGRKVHNRIHAEFEFSDGKIADHKDHFSFYRWSRQALGPLGVALGWTPFVRKQVQQKADRQLRKFMTAAE